MKLTEKEAKKTWCRHALMPIVKKLDGTIIGFEAPAINRLTSNEFGATCLASGCMAWRWAGWENNLPPGTIFRLGTDEARKLAGEPVGFCGADPVPPK